MSGIKTEFLFTIALEVQVFNLGNTRLTAAGASLVSVLVMSAFDPKRILPALPHNHGAMSGIRGNS
jgi:hypothetical protein